MNIGRVAQLVEPLDFREVMGSNPIPSTSIN